MRIYIGWNYWCSMCVIIYKLSSVVMLLADFQPSFYQSALQWRAFLYLLIPIEQFFSAYSLVTTSIQVPTSDTWKHEQTQSRGKSSNKIIFQDITNFYLMVNKNICGKGFCLFKLCLLKVNWKILILYRKKKKKCSHFGYCHKKIINNFFPLFWKANFWTCS